MGESEQPKFCYAIGTTAPSPMPSRPGASWHFVRSPVGSRVGGALSKEAVALSSVINPQSRRQARAPLVSLLAAGLWPEFTCTNSGHSQRPLEGCRSNGRQFKLLHSRAR